MKKKVIALLTSAILSASVLMGAVVPDTKLGVTAEDKVVVTGTNAENKAATEGKNVIAYFPNWGMYNQNHQMIQVGDMPWDKLTVINHAFFTVNKDFKLETTDLYADFDKPMPHSEGWEGLRGFMGEYKYYKQLYPEVKVLISVGGWTRGENFHAMAQTEATRKVFVDSVVDFLKTYPFIDGIDIDWEYPGIDRERDKNDEWDRGCPGGPEDKQNFTSLLKEIREAYNSNGLEDKMLTIANTANYKNIQLQEPDKYIQYLDFINVMTYDMHGAFDDITSHQAAIYPNPKDPFPTEPTNIKEMFNAQAAMKFYTDTYKISPEKLNVGTPYYSRGWGNVDDSTGENGLFADATGTHTGSWDNIHSPGGQYGWFQLKKMENSGGWVKYRDEVSKVPYLYNKTLKAMLTYEDEQSLSDRCDFVTANDYGGIIIWEISGDDIKGGYPMTSIIADKIGPKYPVDEARQAKIVADKVNNGGDFNLTINIQNKSNAVQAKLYENDKLIETMSVNPTADTITTINKKYTKPYGTYNYRVDTVSAAGKVTTGSTLKVVCAVQCIDKPAVPDLAHSNWTGQATYTLNMTNWGGENGSEWRLYEDGVLIFTEELKYGGQGAQRSSYTVKDATNGTHTYYCELVNPLGATPSKPVTVDVTQGKDPEPDIITLAQVAAKYNTTASSANWDAKCDRNKDGIVDLFDLVMVAKTM
ncbi:MAG: glycosyl hydrolase family 18 protein [Clostridium sp.]|uniref:glycosyl hydrolase family 18 protein n=1 Tax=Clostridium sp. TaxID=1506 RepID=UPI00306561AA